MLGLITAKVNAAKDRAEAHASDSQASASTLQARIDDLRRENSDLRSSLQATPSGESSGPTGEPTASEASGATRHKGVLTLANGASANLDASTSNTQWAIEPGDNTELSYYNQNLGAFGILQLKTRKADYETCRQTTGYAPSVNLDAEALVVGNFFCVHTSGDRYAALHLLAVDKDKISFDVVVYEK